ncbi:hypothetical protein CL656_05735 [bacterium]|nr:hypothetical protein [bacterium]|tara:strand:- start:4005 stop:5117 length:1113 start_codon:yes stop_codon:yes gene_type:complete
MRRSIKIILLNPHSKLAKGGPSTYISNLISNFHARGYKNSEWISSFSKNRLFSNFTLLNLFRVFFKLIISSADIIHVHGSIALLGPAILFKRLSFFKKVDLYYTFHTQPHLFDVNILTRELTPSKRSEYTWIKSLICNYFLSNCRKIATVSSSITNRLNKRYDLNVLNSSILNSGTNLKPKHLPNLNKKVKSDPINVLTVGVMYYDWKVVGFPLLIDSISNLRDSGININLTIIGDGYYFKTIREYINKLKFNSFISLPGRIDNVSYYYEKSDIYCQLSMNEGCSHSILEAMSNSLPVIAGNYSGNKEIILNKENGILVHNNIDEVCSAIRELIKDKLFTKKICENAWKKINILHKWEIVANNHLSFYDL